VELRQRPDTAKLTSIRLSIEKDVIWSEKVSCSSKTKPIQCSSRLGGVE